MGLLRWRRWHVGDANASSKLASGVVCQGVFDGGVLASVRDPRRWRAAALT
jgi:hypothetical protein